MSEYRIRFTMLAAVAVLSALSMVSGKTWHLEQGKEEWKPPSEYLLEVAKAKKLLNTGQCEAAEKQLAQLKENFPENVGPDQNAFNAFVNAEILFCKGKFTKAIRSYDKFLNKYYHESELYQAALDRQFSIATAYLSGRKKRVLRIFRIKGYAEGGKIMERIIDRVGLDAPIGIKGTKAMAESYEKRKKFNNAYLMWSRIFSQWQTTETGKDALFAMARCKHAAYRGPKYDASGLISARNYYKNFKKQYPTEKIDADKMLNQINGQLAYKQFSIGRYYQKTGSKQAANFYYRMVMDNWPESTAAKMTNEILKDKGTTKNLRGENVKK